VDRIAQQDHVASLAASALSKTALIDRRRNPTHGYRAVHLVANVNGRLVEIQIRTELQHLWAVWSEGLSTALDPMIKYGGGPKEVREILSLESRVVATVEEVQGATSTGLGILAQLGLPLSLDALVEKLADASLPSELLSAKQFVIGMFELALEERQVKERLIREILAVKQKRQE